MKTEIQETVQNKPVFDPDFHTELIIKDEFENLDSGNLDFCKTRDLEEKKNLEAQVLCKFSHKDDFCLSFQITIFAF